MLPETYQDDLAAAMELTCQYVDFEGTIEEWMAAKAPYLEPVVVGRHVAVPMAAAVVHAAR